jgi:hypothetical protein
MATPRIALLNAGTSNPGLERLHEISLPVPPGWMPQTVGWYMLLLLVALITTCWLHAWFRRFLKNRYRGIALAELAAIERELKVSMKRSPVLLKLPELMKRTALSAFQRIDVAELSGERWLAFLDDTLGGKDFTKGPGRLLGELAYLPAARIEMIREDSISDLVWLSRRWIKHHHIVLISRET